jgi:phosphoheptose isomerase
MNTFKEELINKIKENRPNLGANSIKTYISSLTSINKKWTEKRRLNGMIKMLKI